MPCSGRETGRPPPPNWGLWALSCGRSGTTKVLSSGASPSLTSGDQCGRNGRAVLAVSRKQAGRHRLGCWEAVRWGDQEELHQDSRNGEWEVDEQVVVLVIIIISILTARKNLGDLRLSSSISPVAPRGKGLFSGHTAVQWLRWGLQTEIWNAIPPLFLYTRVPLRAEGRAH